MQPWQADMKMFTCTTWNAGADIDTLCIAPRYVQRDTHFFGDGPTSLQAILQVAPPPFSSRHQPLQGIIVWHDGGGAFKRTACEDGLISLADFLRQKSALGLHPYSAFILPCMELGKKNRIFSSKLHHHHAVSSPQRTVLHGSCRHVAALATMQSFLYPDWLLSQIYCILGSSICNPYLATFSLPWVLASIWLLFRPWPGEMFLFSYHSTVTSMMSWMPELYRLTIPGGIMPPFRSCIFRFCYTVDGSGSLAFSCCTIPLKIAVLEGLHSFISEHALSSWRCRCTSISAAGQC